jgi:chemotaxis protein histidine kinase CheA
MYNWKWTSGETRGKKTVIAVKEIDGIQKVVSKQIEGRFLDKELFDGAAISGAGNVSMIVNMEWLLGFQQVTKTFKSPLALKYFSSNIDF